MATFALIHGGKGTACGWDLVAAELTGHGHDVVAMDPPCDDPLTGWSDYTGAVVEAVGERADLVVVAHSAGGFVAPLVCARVPAELLVLVAGMIPAPEETFEEWWASTGHESATLEDGTVDMSDEWAVLLPTTCRRASHPETWPRRRVCYCESCQEGSRQIEALPNGRSVCDSDGGSAYVLRYREICRPWRCAFTQSPGPQAVTFRTTCPATRRIPSSSWRSSLLGTEH